MHIHRIKNDETVYSVAEEYGVSPIRLGYDNDIDNFKRLAPGRELLVLIPTRTYNVRRGDSLKKISLRFGVGEERIKTLNPELLCTGKLYPGQLLVIKNSEPIYGMGIANGYVYSGCTKNMLLRAMPYLSYVTVCSAVAEGGRIRTIPGLENVVEEAHRYSKTVLMRIYVKDETDILSSEFIKSAVILAKSGGFDGITLSRKPKEDDKDKLAELKKILLDGELLLFIERELKDAGCSSEYADASILTYDKIHLESIPTFEEGEKYYLTKYAELCNPEGAFVDLSSFSVIGSRFIEKGRASAIADRNRSPLTFDSERLVITGDVGRGKKSRELCQESLENTKAKLELISELGYLGISFDVMRIPQAELMMFANMYTQPPAVRKRVICNPPD